jgi:hypothetical protein
MAGSAGGNPNQHFSGSWILNFNIFNDKGAPLLMDHGCF